MLALWALLGPSFAAECTLNNTMMGPNGKCICKPGFVGPEKLTKHGCWTCSPICTYNALCHYPGFCRCKPGFEGDGVTSCRPYLDAPDLIDFSPRAAPLNQLGVVNVSFKSSGTTTASTGFARFGFQVSMCSVTPPGTMICRIPTGVAGPVSFAISLDGNHWSSSGEVFTYLPARATAMGVAVWFIFAALAIGCAVLAYLYISNANTKKPRALETRGPVRIPPPRFL